MRTVARKPAARRNLRFYGDRFVFDPVSGNFHRLSEAAGFLLKAYAGGARGPELVRLLTQRYGIDQTRAKRDVEVFLTEISALDLTEPTP